MNRAARSPKPASERVAEPISRSAQSGRTAPGAGILGNMEAQALLARGALRAKLTVGAPDDPAERDADRMAEAALSGKPAGCSCNSSRIGQAPCPACRSAEALRRKPRNSDSADDVGNLELGAARGLGSTERGLFESHYRADLSDVRIHDNPDAATSAAHLNARAFSLGSRIAFGTGEYRPHTDEGRRLLGHELAHVVLGHTGIRRDAGGAGANAATNAPGTAAPTAATDFDPCTLDVAKLDNRALLSHTRTAKDYVERLVAAKRKGEERYYDYLNLLRRLDQERSARARKGHVWLRSNIGDVPTTLYRLAASAEGDVIAVTPGDTKAAAANDAVDNAILVTDGQFADFLARENIPTVDPANFFGRQDPNAPLTPLNLGVPSRPAQGVSLSVNANDPFGLGNLGNQGATDTGPPFPLPFTGLDPLGGNGRFSPLTAHVFDPFARPVVTAGSFGFSQEAIGGFQSDWRGDLGEARFAAQDPATLRAVLDVNVLQPNFPLYDTFDPRTGQFTSIKTQLPTMPGGAPSLAATQQAWRELFGNADPVKRGNALALLQGNLDPTLTQDELLLRTRIAVNTENVTLAQDSLQAAIRGKDGQIAYEPLLSALLRQQPVSVKLKDGTTKVYNDFNTLYGDFKAKPPLMAEARYRAAVNELAQRARAQIVSNASTAEGDLRPRLDYRQRYDFTNAAEFAGTPNTEAARRQARALQELYFRRIGVPELLDVQTGGPGPVVKGAAGTGAAVGAGTTALLQLPQVVRSWDRDPYAGRRYLSNTVLGGIGGGAQAAADQLLRIRVSQFGLDWAASRAAAGRSVAPVAALTPFARFGGSTALGGVASGGITVGGMLLDERYFGGNYSSIDYKARGSRAFVSGSVAAGAGSIGTALATAGTAALVGAEGGGAGCTVVLPGVGTLACGAVGAIGGFIVGLGAYYLFDVSFGEEVESGVRESLGEQGCTGNIPPGTAPRTSSPAFQPLGFACFEASTPVTMADGTVRRIADVAIGDRILSYNERDRQLQLAVVTATHEAPPDLMLELLLVNGSRILVTAAHKLRTSTGWRAAGELRSGDEVAMVSISGLAMSLTLSTLESAVLVAPAGAVYDLSVEGTHTYFAGGVLAHNKLP